MGASNSKKAPIPDLKDQIKVTDDVDVSKNMIHRQMLNAKQQEIQQAASSLNEDRQDFDSKVKNSVDAKVKKELQVSNVQMSLKNEDLDDIKTQNDRLASVLSETEKSYEEKLESMKNKYAEELNSMQIFFKIF